MGREDGLGRLPSRFAGVGDIISVLEWAQKDKEYTVSSVIENGQLSKSVNFKIGYREQYGHAAL